ncbi:uncharacterized protein EV422DRAFT_547873 [Fimicolochytrium jonesii]|uniref:uncharacterized protein n=1 Tax=Fimicolochytrium jonesii TaxID=1396493 RepID=UPI0022FE2592|nr:uncharacterized protein EV422DRAFT_547873 [Fimicolochytrium jonesii]KAI8815860.1 hypothetical protein EV422DRAFT_547873 [Fimicolochytrium jonesii]
MSSSVVLQSTYSAGGVQHWQATRSGNEDPREDALRLLSEFLCSIGNKAAPEDTRAAALSFLGEPPLTGPVAHTTTTTNTKTHHELPAGQESPLSPINAMVLKLRAARIARETRESQTKNASAVPGKILPTPDEQVLTQTLTNHGIPEVHRVSYKRPRNLHQQATLRRFDQARLRRWWNWHDKHMELLREDKLQKSRRRQFLSNLRTHAWITPPPSPAAGQQNPEQQQQQQRPKNVQATGEIKQRKERAQHLTKLRTSSAPNLRLQGGKAEVVVLSPVSPVDANKEDHLSQRRASLSKLRPRTPTAIVTPPAFPICHKCHSPEDHRRHIVGEENCGALTTLQPDFWSQWAAQETLAEQREHLRTRLDKVDIAGDASLQRKIHRKRCFITEDAAW